MIEVNSEKNSHGYDVFLIKTDEGIFEISFQNNQDLYFSYIPKEGMLKSPDTKEFVITKENYYI